VSSPGDFKRAADWGQPVQEEELVTRKVSSDEELSETLGEFDLADLSNSTVLRNEVNLQSERLGSYWAMQLLRNQSDQIGNEKFEKFMQNFS